MLYKRKTNQLDLLISLIHNSGDESLKYCDNSVSFVPLVNFLQNSSRTPGKLWNFLAHIYLLTLSTKLA